MRLHLAQLGLVLGQAEIRKVGEPRTLQHEQAPVGVVDNASIRCIKDEGLVEDRILPGPPERPCHRLNAAQVKRPLAIDVHLERAAVLPAVHGLQACAQPGTVDRLFAGSKRPAVGRHAGKGEEDDCDADRDRGETAGPCQKAPSKGSRNQPTAQPEQQAGRRNEQHRVRRQAENGVGRRRAGHARIGRPGPKRGNHPRDQQQAERPQPSQPPRQAAGVFCGDRHWASETTVWRRGGSM